MICDIDMLLYVYNFADICVIAGRGLCARAAIIHWKKKNKFEKKLREKILKQKKMILTNLMILILKHFLANEFLF